MAEPTPNEIAEVLDKAHDELLVRGWTQGVLVREGAVCAEGAIRCALGGTPNNMQSIPLDSENERLAFHALVVLSRQVGGSAFGWNDDERRTIDDVLDAFRHAAKRVREVA